MECNDIGSGVLLGLECLKVLNQEEVILSFAYDSEGRNFDRFFGEREEANVIERMQTLPRRKGWR